MNDVVVKEDVLPLQYITSEWPHSSPSELLGVKAGEIVVWHATRNVGGVTCRRTDFFNKVLDVHRTPHAIKIEIVESLAAIGYVQRQLTVPK